MDFERAKQAQTYIHQQTQILVEEAYHNDKALKKQKATIESLQKQIEILAEHPTEVEFRGLVDKIDDLQSQLYKRREYGRLKDEAKMKVEKKWFACQSENEELRRTIFRLEGHNNAIVSDLGATQHELCELIKEHTALRRTIEMNDTVAGFIKDQIYHLDVEAGLKRKIVGLDKALDDAQREAAANKAMYLQELEKTRQVLDVVNGRAAQEDVDKDAW